METRARSDWPAGDDETVRLLRSFDWGTTPLGPSADWPPSLRTMVDLIAASAFPMVVLHGPELRQIYNDGYRALMGPKHPAGLGQPTRACWPEVWHINEPIYERVRSGEAVRLEDALYPVDRGDGIEDARFTLSYSPLRDAGGAISGVLVIVVETTGRLNAERELARSEEEFRAFTSATSDVVYRMSADWTEMRFLQGRDFIRDSLAPSQSWLATYIPADEHARVEAAIDRAIDGRSVFELEHRVIRVDGSIGWTWSRAAPMLDGDGNVVGWLGTATDIGPRKAFEAALSEADERKDEFLATLAHELRSPLSPIKHALHLMRINGDPATWPALRDIVDRQTSHMVRLVDDLLDIARINRGDISLRRSPLDLRAVLQRALEVARPAIDRAGHRLLVDLPGDPLVVDGDADRLQQVFGNLLNNAAKYSGTGGRVSLTALHDGKSITVRVRDAGRGIAAADLPHLFSMFHQVDRLHSGGGLGIGLNLARRLAGMHGGDVEAFSEGLGRGSTFSVRLPPSPNAVAPAPKVAAATPLAGRRVLVVDDSGELAETSTMLLNALGAEARFLTRGAEVLPSLDRWTPSVILLDIGMPEMDGCAVAELVRADPRYAAIRLVAVTGWGRDEDRERTRAAGFDQHLTKPVPLDVLTAAVLGSRGA